MFSNKRLLSHAAKRSLEQGDRSTVDIQRSLRKKTVRLPGICQHPVRIAPCSEREDVAAPREEATDAHRMLGHFVAAPGASEPFLAQARQAMSPLPTILLHEMPGVGALLSAGVRLLTRSPQRTPSVVALTTNAWVVRCPCAFQTWCGTPTSAATLLKLPAAPVTKTVAPTRAGAPPPPLFLAARSGRATLLRERPDRGSVHHTQRAMHVPLHQIAQGFHLFLATRPCPPVIASRGTAGGNRDGLGVTLRHTSCLPGSLPPLSALASLVSPLSCFSNSH
jgi:hypothetical protein